MIKRDDLVNGGTSIGTGRVASELSQRSRERCFKIGILNPPPDFIDTMKSALNPYFICPSSPEVDTDAQ